MTRVPATQLAMLVRAALTAREMSAEHAELVADVLVGTSLRGIDTHGIRLLPTYLAELDGGRSRARPDMQWSASAGACRRLDAGAALGPVAGMLASKQALQCARQHGIGVVAVGNSNHFGPAGAYAIEIARAGAIGIAMTNADALVAPFGGTRALLGTNPLSIAALADDDEMFCLDTTTSQVSYSKVRDWLARGVALPAGWALRHDASDAEGAQSAAEITALQPLGGYKGHGLGMAIAMLCSLLTDMPLDHELSHLYTPPFDQPRQVSHLFLALDIAAFVAQDTFRARLAEYMRYVRSQPAVPGQRVMVPGDPEVEALRDRTAHGVPLSTTELELLRVIDQANPAPARIGL